MIQVNYLDCTVNLKGTGTIACEIPDGVPVGVITVPKDWELDVATETFDTAYIKGQVKAKNFTPYLNSIDYEDQSETADIFTSSTKVKLKTVAGKPGFALHYSKGYHFHAAAYEANSFDAVNAILVYDNGVYFAARSKDGTKIKGHTVGMFDTENFMHKKGGDPQKTVITFQLTDAYEYNVLGILLDPTANGFDAKAIKGIVDVNIANVANTPTTQVDVRVTADANGAIGIGGAVLANFAASGIGAVTLDSVAAGATAGDYSLTFSADVSTEYASGALNIKFYDSGDSTNVVEIANVLYEGNNQ